MQFYLNILLSFIGIAFAACNHDNCARAIMGVHHHGTSVSSDCSSFLEMTIIPRASTISVTITSVINATTTFSPVKRQEVVTIPAYATGKCLDGAAYASACFCLGIMAATITVPPPNGVCTSTQCQGLTCGNFTTCSGNSTCYCFTSASNSGFCGQNALCSGLTPCANDFDCAVKTCCSAPSVAQPGVCLKGVCGNPAANLKMASIARRWIGDTAAGNRH
ncbi:hypothetical protein N431DRAFT_498470 [Stipitochalara longipes BDJ]|nr:hypothetical protein N431DRAFT_498470 [Stipitochalara longipes BDJ]